MLKWGDHPVFLHLDTLGPRFLNQAFHNIHDRQILTERSYEPRYEVFVEICSLRKMFTDILKVMKTNFDVDKI